MNTWKTEAARLILNLCAGRIGHEIARLWSSPRIPMLRACRILSRLSSRLFLSTNHLARQRCIYLIFPRPVIRLCDEICQQAGSLRHDPHQEQSDLVHLRYYCCDLARRVLQQSNATTLQNNKTLIRESFCGEGTHIWFDKCFSILIFNDARAAWHYEHTFADAPVPSLGCEHAMVSWHALHAYFFAIGCKTRNLLIQLAMHAVNIRISGRAYHEKTCYAHSHSHFMGCLLSIYFLLWSCRLKSALCMSEWCRSWPSGIKLLKAPCLNFVIQLIP